MKLLTNVCIKKSTSFYNMMWIRIIVIVYPCRDFISLSEVNLTWYYLPENIARLRQVPGFPKRIQEVQENCKTFLPDALKRSEFTVGKEWNIKVKYTLQKYFYFHKVKNIEFSFLSVLWWQIKKPETFEGFIK